MKGRDHSAPSRVANDDHPVPPITESQRRAWRQEIGRRAVDEDERRELLGMVLGEAS